MLSENLSPLLRPNLEIAKDPNSLLLGVSDSNSVRALLLYFHRPTEDAIVIVGFVRIDEKRRLTAEYVSSTLSVEEDLPSPPERWLYHCSPYEQTPFILSRSFEDLRTSGVPRKLSKDLIKEIIKYRPRVERVFFLLESNLPIHRFSFYSLIHICSRDKDLFDKVREILFQWADSYFRLRDHWYLLEYNLDFLNSSNSQLERVQFSELSEDNQHYLRQSFYARHPDKPLSKTLWRCRWNQACRLVSNRSALIVKGYAYLWAADAHLWFSDMLLSQLTAKFRQLDDQFGLAKKEHSECNWVPGCDSSKVRAVVYRDVRFFKINKQLEKVPDKKRKKLFEEAYIDKYGVLEESEYVSRKLSNADRFSILIANYHKEWMAHREQSRLNEALLRSASLKITDPCILKAIEVYQKAIEDDFYPRVAFMRAFGNFFPSCISYPIHVVIQEKRHLKHPQREVIFPFLYHAKIPLEIVEVVWRDIYRRSSHRGDHHKQRTLDAHPSYYYKKRTGKEHFFSCKTVIDISDRKCCPFNEKDPLVDDIEDLVTARQLLCRTLSAYPENKHLSPVSFYRHQLVKSNEQ